jgi:hypothetical protein
MMPMPPGILLYNGAGEPCDMAAGPCLCGAWHNLTETLRRINNVFSLDGMPGDIEQHGLEFVVGFRRLREAKATERL